MSLFLALISDSDKFNLVFAIAYNIEKEEQTIAIAIVRRVITIRGAIQKRSNESMYKTVTKDEVMRLRATTFAIDN